MAIMNPQIPVPGTESQAEIKLFWALETLPPGYKIFHSVKWYFFDSQHKKYEGETDFIIFDPEDKILFLEVKGGQHISYDAHMDQWYSNGEKIDDPFWQAQNAEHIFLRQVKEKLSISQMLFTGHAVAFPDTEIIDSLGMDKPREIIIDENDLQNISQWMERVFNKIAQETKPRRFTDNDWKKIEGLIRESKSFNPSIQNYFRKLDQIVQDLTEEQYEILNVLRACYKAGINGSAGTGKTLVAVEKAIRLSNSNFSVLFLCHNPYLAEDIKKKIVSDNVKVCSFSQFVQEVIGIEDDSLTDPIFESSNVKEPWSQFNQPSQANLDQALENMINDAYPKFDAVIVDEGQDFKPEWWLLVEASLKDSLNRVLYVFFDDRQVLSSFHRQQLPVPLPDFYLSKNCRNAGKIYQIIQQLDESMPETGIKLKNEGIVNEWIYRAGDEKDLFQNLREAILDTGRYSPDYKNIVVLSGENNTLRNSLFNGFVFDKPGTERTGNITPLDWQNFMNRHLKKWGFTPSKLSNEPYPTNNDRKLVSSFCRDWCASHRNRYLGSLREYPNKVYPKIDTFRWSFDNYGNLAIYSGNEIYDSEIWPIMNFLGSKDWTNTLPFPTKKIRLTPQESFSDFPEYKNILFANIPIYKGLEANGVVFIYYDYTGGYDSQLAASLYVALSRAKYLLNVVAPMSIVNEVERLKDRINL